MINKKRGGFPIGMENHLFSIIRLCLVLNAVLITIGTYLMVDAAAIFLNLFFSMANNFCSDVACKAFIKRRVLGSSRMTKLSTSPSLNTLFKFPKVLSCDNKLATFHFGVNAGVFPIRFMLIKNCFHIWLL